MSFESSSKEPAKPKEPFHRRPSQINRDKPLIAERRPSSRSEQPSQLRTNSASTSHIPTPSPKKNPVKQRFGTKPRQAVGNGRTLTAAFNATASGADENKRFSTLRASERTQRQSALKNRPVQRTEKSKSVDTRQATRTPSPRARGRSLSAISPVASPSSPPRALTEAYQRIVDEENLANQENDSVDEDMSSYMHHNAQPDISTDIESLSPQGRRNSGSPTSLKALRRVLPRDQIAGSPSTLGWKCEGETHTRELNIDPESLPRETMSRGSPARVRAQHERDERRLNGVLRRDSLIFSKARRGDMLGLTAEDLRRKEDSKSSSGSGTAGGSVGSRGSDRSLNIPREWGRKGKGGKDWLLRIREKDGKLTGDLSKSPSIAITAKPDINSPTDSIIDWIATAADTPLPTEERSSLQIGSSSRDLTPTSTVHAKSSLDKIREWEFDNDDFTARSLQMSNSPPIRVQNSKLDRIRQREMENLEKSAVTTSRLGELREKASGDRLRVKLSGAVYEDLQQPSRGIEIIAKGRQNSFEDLKLEQTHEREEEQGSLKPAYEDEGDPIPNTPIIIYKGPSIRNDSEIRDLASSIGGRPRVSRPSELRQDSQDLLRSLARATSASASPSPLRDFGSNSQSDRRELIDKDTLTPNSEAASEGQIREHKIPASETDDTIQEEVGRISNLTSTIDQTPRRSNSLLNAKTPLVTGAWIETPMPASSRELSISNHQMDVQDIRSSSRSPKLVKEAEVKVQTRDPEFMEDPPLLINTAPRRQQSALATIIEKAKNKTRSPKKEGRPSLEEEDNSLALGEDTIQSLEKLIVKDEEPFRSQELKSNTVDLEHSISTEDGDPQSPSQQGRQIELLAYSQLTKRLGNLGLSIRDAKNGISSLERAVSTANVKECNQAGEFHDFIWPCEKCGCVGKQFERQQDRIGTLRGDDTGWEVSISLPRLWTWRKEDWRPRLTWLGVLTMLMWTVAGEVIACNLYAPPYYASSMSGYGVDYNRPRPPFVLFKALYYRTPLGYIVAPFWILLRLLLSLLVNSLSTIIGFVSGFIFGDAGGVGDGGGIYTIRQPVAWDERIPRPSWGPDLSMMDDEYI